ncbi:unnamed protein product, partial [Hapterophycus canaliculatus]
VLCCTPSPLGGANTRHIYPSYHLLFAFCFQVAVSLAVFILRVLFLEYTALSGAHGLALVYVSIARGLQTFACFPEFLPYTLYEVPRRTKLYITVKFMGGRTKYGAGRGRRGSHRLLINVHEPCAEAGRVLAELCPWPYTLRLQND